MLNRTVKHFLSLGRERGVELEVIQGGRHIKLYYGPHLIIVVSNGTGPKGDPRMLLNKNKDFSVNLEKAIKHEQEKGTRGSR